MLLILSLPFTHTSNTYFLDPDPLPLPPVTVLIQCGNDQCDDAATHGKNGGGAEYKHILLNSKGWDNVTLAPKRRRKLTAKMAKSHSTAKDEPKANTQQVRGCSSLSGYFSRVSREVARIGRAKLHVRGFMS